MTQELPTATEAATDQEKPAFRIGTDTDETLFVQAWKKRGKLTVDIAPPAMGDGRIESYRGTDMEPETILANIHDQYITADTLGDIEYDPLREEVREVFF